MNTSEIIIAGDTAGIEWRLPVLRFKGSDPAGAEGLYPGSPARQRTAGHRSGAFSLRDVAPGRKRRARSRSDIIVVPHANPIGAAQSHFGELQGRFDLGRAPTSTANSR